MRPGTFTAFRRALFLLLQLLLLNLAPGPPSLQHLLEKDLAAEALLDAILGVLEQSLQRGENPTAGHAAQPIVRGDQPVWGVPQLLQAALKGPQQLRVILLCAAVILAGFQFPAQVCVGSHLEGGAFPPLPLDELSFMDAGFPADRLEARLGLPGHGHALHSLHVGVEGAHALLGGILVVVCAGVTRLVLGVGLVLGGGLGGQRAAPA